MHIDFVFLRARKIGRVEVNLSSPVLSIVQEFDKIDVGQVDVVFYDLYFKPITWLKITQS